MWLALAISLAVPSGILVIVPPSFAQTQVSAGPESEQTAELIKLHRLLADVRNLEIDSRDLYFNQSFILLYLHGDRTEWIGSYNRPARMLTEAVTSLFVPKINRLNARIERSTDLTDEEKLLFKGAITKTNEAINAGFEIADLIRSDRIDEATNVFHEKSLPAFKASWRDLFTLNYRLEDRFPKR
jgi:hypothetical protein